MKNILLRWFALTLIGVGCATSAAAASRDLRKKVVLLLADPHVNSANLAIPEFAAKYLDREFRVVHVTGSITANENAFDRIDEVADADVLFVSVTRRAPPKAQLEVIRRYVSAGKAIVGIRTASHAFAISPGQPIPAGAADWPAWDVEAIGGTYGGRVLPPANPVVTTPSGEPPNAIVSGLVLPYTANSILYKMTPLMPGVQVILVGTIASQPAHPVAWTFTRKDGGRSFYTSMGVMEDFKNAGFNEFLRNAIRWAAGNKVIRPNAG